MCGLFGAYSGYLNKQELNNVKQLGILSQFRGIDSTGIAVVSKKKNKARVQVVKEVVDSSNFFWYSNEANEALEENNVSIVIGHCRAATHGSVNQTNAHPIQERHITGVHNGTIDKFAPAKAEEDTMSDSRLLMRNISYKGLFPTLREAGYNGAWAVSYFDHSNNTLNFIRNMKRPLWFMYNKNHSTLYWASEKRMLDFLASGDSSAFDSPFLAKEDTRITFQLGNMNAKAEPFHMYVPTVAPVVAPPAAKEENKAHAVPFLEKRAALKARLQEKREEKAREDAAAIAKLVNSRVASGASVPLVPVQGNAPTSSTATDTSGTITTPVDSKLTKPGCHDEDCKAEAHNDSLPFVPDPPASSSTSSTTLRQRDFKDLHEYMAEVSKSKSTPSSTLRYRGFGGKIIDIRQARLVMQDGCEFCHDPKVPLNEMFWLSPKTFVCQDCLSDDRLSEIYSGSLISKGEIIYDN